MNLTFTPNLEKPDVQFPNFQHLLTMKPLVEDLAEFIRDNENFLLATSNTKPINVHPDLRD